MFVNYSSAKLTKKLKKEPISPIILLTLGDSEEER